MRLVSGKTRSSAPLSELPGKPLRPLHCGALSRKLKGNPPLLIVPFCVEGREKEFRAHLEAFEFFLKLPSLCVVRETSSNHSAAESESELGRVQPPAACSSLSEAQECVTAPVPEWGGKRRTQGSRSARWLFFLIFSVLAPMKSSM